MKFYVATRSIVDALHGYHISSGTIIKTENQNWIKRFGSAFSEIAAPDNPEILEDVVFVRSEGEVAPKQELVVEAQEEAPAYVETSEEEEADEGDDSAENADDDTLSTRDLSSRPRRVKKKSAKK